MLQKHREASNMSDSAHLKAILTVVLLLFFSGANAQAQPAFREVDLNTTQSEGIQPEDSIRTNKDFAALGETVFFAASDGIRGRALITKEEKAKKTPAINPQPRAKSFNAKSSWSTVVMKTPHLLDGLGRCNLARIPLDWPFPSPMPFFYGSIGFSGCSVSTSTQRHSDVEAASLFARFGLTRRAGYREPPD
jgi:hypothetical protein